MRSGFFLHCEKHLGHVQHVLSPASWTCTPFESCNDSSARSVVDARSPNNAISQTLPFYPRQKHTHPLLAAHQQQAPVV